MVAGVRRRFAACGRAGLVVLALAGPMVAWAAGFEAVVEGDGAPLAGAVVSLHPDVPVALPPAQAEVDQVDATFVPAVLPVTVGTRVSFPNSDNTLHQVYSFSPTKRFDLPLYSGRTAQPVTFDQAGVVAIGCNIHDWMVGHIVVLDTPYFATTGADGRVRIEAPPGNYRMEVWHPRAAEVPAPQRVDVGVAATAPVHVGMALVPPPPPRPGNERLRALQEKFRSLGRDP